MVGFLDAFIGLGVILATLVVFISPLIYALKKKGGIYRGREGHEKRDEINKKYNTNLGSAIIAVLCFGVYLLICYGIIMEWGASFAIILLCAFLFLPAMMICVFIIMIYIFSVHGYANIKGK